MNSDGSLDHKVHIKPDLAKRFLKLKARLNATDDVEVYKRVFQIVEALAEDTDKGEKIFKHKPDGSTEELNIFP